jgi:hypothetical protein
MINVAKLAKLLNVTKKEVNRVLYAHPRSFAVDLKLYWRIR